MPSGTWTVTSWTRCRAARTASARRTRRRWRHIASRARSRSRPSAARRRRRTASRCMAERPPIRVLGLRGPRQPAFFEEPEPQPRKGEFQVETLYTGLSAGTELTFYKGTNPYLRSGLDPELGVFVEGRPGIEYPVKRL